MQSVSSPFLSSLPQGWHGISGPSKPVSGSGGVTGSSVPATIRKKWNSPQSSNVPQTRLPSYKPNLKAQNNLNSTYRIKPNITACPTPQSKVPSPVKPSPVKEYQNEISKLKQELSTIKAENSILKAKVRRVDDENLQKGRQIEKMRAEIKALQKNEFANNRKSKESQELLLLRQKCLRLENALKDKDLAIKKLTSELTVKKEDPESSKTSATGLQKQIYPASQSRLPKNSSLRSIEKQSISAKSSLSRASQSLKTEVTKLRDMIHKLEKENQDLQQQAKLHCQEIRRLKVQLKSKDKITHSQASISRSSTTEQMKNIRNKSVLTESNSQASSQYKVGENLFVPKQRLMKCKKSPLQNSIAQKSVSLTSHAVAKQAKSQIASPQKIDSKIGKVAKVANGTIKRNNLNKPMKDNTSKLPLTKHGSADASSKPILQRTVESVPVHVVRNSDLEFKIQEMRENLAAKKIQRSWRQHQKNLQHSTVPEFQTKEKALTFIISSIKHHKSRKEKLNFLVKKKNLHSQNIRKEVFIEAVEASRRKVWEQACT